MCFLLKRMMKYKFFNRIKSFNEIEIMIGREMAHKINYKHSNKYSNKVRKL